MVVVAGLYYLFLQSALTNMLGRRINDFDNFITNNLASPRKLPLANVHNYDSNQNKPERNPSPNRITHTRKPMISPSPSRSPRAQSHKPKPKAQPQPRRDTLRASQAHEHCCSNENHPYKKADFFIHIEEEDMFYCGACATQAASQGFAINRIQAKKVRNMPQYQEYKGNKRYHELTELLKGIMGLENEFRLLQLRRVSDHYEGQKEMLNCFYDQLENLVQKMRVDHLSDLEAESERNNQKEAFSLDNLRMHVEELGEVWEDIEANIQEVVENVDQVNYEHCMNTHRNSLRMFNHKIEEYREEQEQLITYSQGGLQRKVKHFEEGLLGLWEEEAGHHHQSGSDNRRTVKNVPESRRQAQYPQSDRSTTVRNVHEMLPRPAANKTTDGQGAFRNLFPEEESEQRLPQASPQFKAF